MSPVVSAEIVAGALILLALFALTYIFVRRRLLSSGAPLMLCALQPHGRSQYRLGLLRFSGQLAGVVHPDRALAARRPHLGAPRLELGPPNQPETTIAGLPEAVTVDCHYGSDTFALALAPAGYTAMRSWLESSPPGFNVNVA